MIKMKLHYVGYYSEEENMKNTLKICSVRQIFLNLLSIVGIVLVVILNMKKKNNIPFSSEGCNCEDDIKYNGVTTEEKCNNINYNDLSK
ncbi:hypothetical protein PFFCH_01773 [Plasmodium falciparum FCH/4]|uniref:Uncharacterized protein n=2 Tax=Plasmodium falciparum TaxID=5833 RepID=A0A024VQQ3_PLAFA|nr:hypothetical protein PFFCH_01773 [Plasmodium falciparum FCH/4]